MGQQQRDDMQLVVKLTEEMLDHSNQAEWDLIQEKEHLRKKLLDEIFAIDIDEQDGQDIGNKIVYVLKLNEKITANLVAGKQSLGLEISQLNKAKSATHAYLKNAN